MAIIQAIVRVAQLVFAVIVLALSIKAVRWQVYGKAPATSGYNSFAGAWATLFALIGLAAAFVSSIPGLIMAAFDALTFIILLAGGIAYAVQMKGADCSSLSFSRTDLRWADLIGGGSYTDDNGNAVYGVPYYQDGDSYAPDLNVVKGRCQTILADDAFLFLAAIATLAAGIMVFLAHRRGGSRHSAV